MSFAPRFLIYLLVLFAPSFIFAAGAASQTTTIVEPGVSVSAPAPSARAELTFKRPLWKGMSGSDVKALQESLSKIPGIYDGGSATGYFGASTDTAVKRLQAREGVVSIMSEAAGYGIVGQKTLAKINEIVLRGSTVATSSQIASKPAATSTPAVSTSTPTALKAATLVRDTAPPIRSFGSPSNTLPAGAAEIKISLMTNESARCYWSSSPNTPFSEMATPFSTTGGLTHSFTARNIAVGDYAFFVKCRDQYVNTNISDFPIIFSIERRYSGRDYDSPRVFMSSPTNGDSVTEGRVSLSAAAADNAGVAGVNFFLNKYDLNAEDTTSPFGIAVMLEPGSYSAFAVARDADGNRATSTPVAFTVTPKTVASAVNVYQSSVASVFYAFAQIFELLFRP